MNSQKTHIICPNCNYPSFNVVSISGTGYTRSCKKCAYQKNFKLPKIQKKIIYLDQFVISNIMKSLNPKCKAHKSILKDPYWLELYKILDTLIKYQLIVCPESMLHQEESLMYSDFEALQKVYEYLSCGNIFRDHDTIIRFEICRHFKNYLAGCPEIPPDINAESVIIGELRKWQAMFQVLIHFPINDEEKQQIRQSRDNLCFEMEKIFNCWKTETTRSFNDWKMEEVRSFGEAALRIHYNYLNTLSKISLDNQIVEIENIYWPAMTELIHCMLRITKKLGLNYQDSIIKIKEYFNSEYILNVPYIRISSMLFASIARKAVAGQINPPGKGVFTDVIVISSFLSFCDVIFIDDEFATYLKEHPLCDEIRYPIKIFSNNNRGQFFEYLSELLDDANPDHINLVNEIYGEDCVKPDINLFI